MRTLFPLLLLGALTLGPSFAKPSSVRFSYLRTASSHVYVVTVDLNDPTVKVATAVSRWGTGSVETYRSMVTRLRPTAAITGTFFCSRKRIPTGDIVTDGQLVHYGGVGTGLAITPANQAVMVPRRKYHHVNWSGFETVLCAGPRLLWDGRMVVDPRGEGFRDRRMINARLTRLGVGITATNKLKLVTAKGPLHLRDLAKVMRSLGCVDAVDLDQGSSSAMYCRGKTIQKPSRALTNMLMVFDTHARYAAALPRLIPQAWIARSPEPATSEVAPAVPAGPVGSAVPLAPPGAARREEDDGLQ
ncbi:MAG TPA: phosphodiester glycosidase family protein [Armatimonadota bacterium]